MSKKEKRLESKKRKAEAFLTVAKLNDVEPRKKKKSNAENESSTNGLSEESSVQQTNSDYIPLEPVAKDTSEMTAEECVEEALQRMRKEIKQRQKTALGKAKVFTTPENLRMVGADGSVHDDVLMPLFVVDLQHLLLYAIQGNIASYKPRWCKLLRPGKVKQVAVISLEGVSIDEYKKYGECFPCIRDEFEPPMEMVTPTQYGKTVKDDLFTVPWSESYIKQTVKDKVWAKKKDRLEMVTVTPVAKDQTDSQASNPDNDVFSRRRLLNSSAQMIQEKFPLPIVTDSGYCDDYIATKEEYAPVTDRSPLLGLDCEMCMTEAGRNELTWIGVVNEKMETVFETLVKPHNTITNYLTKFSGVTPGMLDKITTRLSDVQQSLRRILPGDAILCGHSLMNDLHALKMFHPYVIDTSVIYNLRGVRQYKPGLRLLTHIFLNRDIQDDPLKGHNPVEDAMASLQLVQLKLRNGPTFGDVMMGGSLAPTQESISAMGPESGQRQGGDEDTNTGDTPSGDPKETDENKSQNQDNSCNQGHAGNCDTAEGTKCDQQAAKTDASPTNTSPNCDKTAENKCQTVQNESQSCTNCKTSDLENNQNNNKTKSDVCKNNGCETGVSDEMGTEKSRVSDGMCTDKTGVSEKTAIDPSVQRRELLSGTYRLQSSYFFDGLGNKYNQDFFELVHKSNKSAIVIGKEDDVRSMRKREVQVCGCETDKQKVRKLKEYKNVSFSFTELSFFTDCQVHLQSEETVKKCLCRLDERVRQILKHLEEDTLVAVLLTGRSDEVSCHNAMSVVKML